jgi:hypothetical protein
MPKSRGGFSEPLTHQPVERLYEYRRGFGMGNSAEFVHYFDEFTSAVATNVPTGWTAAVIDTGATVTQLDTDTFPGGVLKFASDATTEGAALYLPLMVELNNKEFFMEARVYTVDADDTDVQMGLTARNATTNPEDLWTTAATDLIAFGVLDGDATVTMLCDKNNSGAAANLGTIDLEDATWHTLAIHVTGASSTSNMSVRGYVDGELAITWDVETEIPDDLVLSPFIGARTGGDLAHVVYVDYVRFVSVR